MSLIEVFQNSEGFKNRKRVARGIGSGKGKTAGRGHKGQKSRSGVSINGFEGGQMPIHKRLPKRGFNNIFAQKKQIVNLSTLQVFIDKKRLDPSKVVNNAALKASGIIKNDKIPVKLLGNGDVKVKLDVNLFHISKTAREKIEKVGGSVKIEFVADSKSE